MVWYTTSFKKKQRLIAQIEKLERDKYSYY
jgi:hypothetical protein